jgi:hypothetical protein
VRLHELTVVRASLEAAFMELTADSVEYRAAGDEPGDQQGHAASGRSGTGQPGAPEPAQELATQAQGRHASEGGI